MAISRGCYGLPVAIRDPQRCIPLDGASSGAANRLNAHRLARDLRFSVLFMRSVTGAAEAPGAPTRALSETYGVWNRKLHLTTLGLYFLLFLWLFTFTGLLLNLSSWTFAEFWPKIEGIHFERQIELSSIQQRTGPSQSVDAATRNRWRRNQMDHESRCCKGSRSVSTGAWT